VIGQEKATTPEPAEAHFGMANRRLPQGGALHELADVRRPVVSLVDTAGAYPASTQRSAARPNDRALDFGMPGAQGAVDLCLIGEGGSGGAIPSHGESRLHARARHLFGDLAGRRRLDPVARFDARQDAATSMEDHSSDLLDRQDHRLHRCRAPAVRSRREA